MIDIARVIMYYIRKEGSMTRVEIMEIIRADRRAREITQKEAGELAGIPHSNISGLETGRWPHTSFEMVTRYCEALGFELVVQRKEERT